LKKLIKFFTLYEIIIVLAIITFILTISIPRTDIFRQKVIILELDKLFNIFNYLQQRAIASNNSQQLTFNIKNNSYLYLSLTNKSISYQLSYPIIFGFLEAVKGPPSTPTKLINKAITFQTKNKTLTVTFLSNGKITPGTIYIIDKYKKLMCALTCPISQVSYIRKYIYKNGQWICL
jgi:Tfp pilus assembly protein FimT